MLKMWYFIPFYWSIYNFLHPEKRAFKATIHFKGGTKVTARFTKLEWRQEDGKFLRVAWKTVGPRLLHTIDVNNVEAIVSHA